MVCKHRQDVIAWTGGIIFIVAFLIGLWGWGYGVQWYARSGYFHEENNNTKFRLMNEPFGCNDTTIPGRHGQDCVAHWYYWKLPLSEVKPLTRAMVWLFYSCHQLLIWGLLYRAQMLNSTVGRKAGKKYGTDLKWFNWTMLAVNALFHILHLVQTHWTYDGLAQDVDVFSSQGAVIMMVVFIMLIEYKDRGMILMWPNPKSTDQVARHLRLSNEPIRLIRKYHGYIFSWAIIYTFWYHPMENTVGHILGFFHSAIVLLQGSLAFTKIHLNRYWRLLNESWVLVHGTYVAVQIANPTQANGSNFWPMFAFGFGFLFAFTQIFGLSFWWKISQWFRIIPPIIYVAVVLSLSATLVRGRDDSTRSGFHRIYELCYVPAMFYIAVLIGWGSAALSIRVGEFTTKRCCSASRCCHEPSVTRQFLYFFLVMLMFVVFIIIAYLTKHASANGLLLMIVYSLFFTAMVGVSLVWFDGLFKRDRGVFPELSNAKELKMGKDDKAGGEHVNYVYVDDL